MTQITNDRRLSYVADIIPYKNNQINNQSECMDGKDIFHDVNTILLQSPTSPIKPYFYKIKENTISKKQDVPNMQQTAYKTFPITKNRTTQKNSHRNCISELIKKIL